MSDVRRAVIWFIVLIAVVLAGDRALAWILQGVLARSQFRFSRLYRGGNDAGILALGDSRGVHSFYAPAMERMTGVHVLNLSYNGMSPRVAEAVLLDYLDRNRAPRVVIVEVTGAGYPSAIVSQLRTYSSVSPRLALLYARQYPSGAVVNRIFHLVPLNSDFFLQALHYMRVSDQDWIFHQPMPAALRTEDLMKDNPVRMPLAENLDALARMVSELRRRGIEVRLIVTPYFAPLAVADIPKFIDRLTPRLRTVDPQVRIWNYVDAVKDPDEFADRVHLNERGSRSLLKILQRDGAFDAGVTGSRGVVVNGRSKAAT